MSVDHRADTSHWYYWGQWVNCVLFTSPWHGSMKTPVFRDLGLLLRADMKCLRGHFYFLKSDLDNIENVIRREKNQWFKRYFEMCEKATENFNIFSGDLASFIPTFIDFLGHATLTEFGDLVLEKIIREQCGREKVFFEDVFAVMKPERKTLLAQYDAELSVLKEENVDAFVEKWRWVGTHALEGESLTREKVLDAIRQGKRIESNMEQYAATFSLSLNDLVEIGKELVFYRSNLVETVDRKLFQYRSVFEEIAKKLDVTYFDIISMTHQELLMVLEGADLPQDVNLRKHEFGYVGIGSDVHILLGDELEREIKIHATKTEIVDDVRGMIAYRGIARGRVCIVNGPGDSGKVRVGDILVAAETLPYYIMAMRRAAAFVTNQGGITSHAALTAREMKKPCIIGTKTATQVLKDGDLVEVDAINGVVKVIQRAS